MIVLRAGQPLVVLERSGVIESVHTGHLIVLGADGSTVLSVGETEQALFARSCVKPLQATGMLRAGFDGSAEEIALASASHSGSLVHRALIEQSLTGAGLTASDLQCPPDLPIGEDERRTYLRSGAVESRLAMNCSGKHAAMLRTCLLNDWSIGDYLSPGHPLQISLAATVTDLTGETLAGTGVDGCGAPLFAFSLLGLARGFAAIARSDGVASAMRSCPELVGGVGRFNTRLMQGVGGLIAKDGAEGCYAAALADGGVVAVKIDDGASRAAEQTVLAGLGHLGVDAPVLDDLRGTPVLGGGVPVGTIHSII
jgi:L-asparaginase II